MKDIVYLSQIKDISILWPGDLHMFADFLLRAYDAKDLRSNKQNKSRVVKSRPTLKGLANRYSIVTHVLQIEIESKIMQYGLSLGATVEHDIDKE
jgi:hypothetical protein